MEPECSVCLDLPATHACVPCGHMASCAACASVVMAEDVPTCPLCRAALVSMLRVYISASTSIPTAAPLTKPTPATTHSPSAPSCPDIVSRIHQFFDDAEDDDRSTPTLRTYSLRYHSHMDWRIPAVVEFSLHSPRTLNGVMYTYSGRDRSEARINGFTRHVTRMTRGHSIVFRLYDAPRGQRGVIDVGSKWLDTSEASAVEIGANEAVRFIVL